MKFDGVKKVDENVMDKTEQIEKDSDELKKSSMFSKTRDIVKNLINCCIE